MSRGRAVVVGSGPNGLDGDLTEALEGQVERFAPGFRETILARAVSMCGLGAARDALSRRR